MFERVILMIWGSGIKNDDLQFGFKERTGTAECTWLVQETLNYYLRGGSEPFLVSFDCPKAFPSSRWDILFEQMSEQLPGVIVRCVIYSYIHDSLCMLG